MRPAPIFPTVCHIKGMRYDQPRCLVKTGREREATDSVQMVRLHKSYRRVDGARGSWGAGGRSGCLRTGRRRSAGGGDGGEVARRSREDRLSTVWIKMQTPGVSAGGSGLSQGSGAGPGVGAGTGPGRDRIGPAQLSLVSRSSRLFLASP